MGGFFSNGLVQPIVQVPVASKSAVVYTACAETIRALALVRGRFDGSALPSKDWISIYSERESSLGHELKAPSFSTGSLKVSETLKHGFSQKIITFALSANKEQLDRIEAKLDKCNLENQSRSEEFQQQLNSLNNEIQVLKKQGDHSSSRHDASIACLEQKMEQLSQSIVDLHQTFITVEGDKKLAENSKSHQEQLVSIAKSAADGLPSGPQAIAGVLVDLNPEGIANTVDNVLFVSGRKSTLSTLVEKTGVDGLSRIVSTYQTYQHLRKQGCPFAQVETLLSVQHAMSEHSKQVILGQIAIRGMVNHYAQKPNGYSGV